MNPNKGHNPFDLPMAKAAAPRSVPAAPPPAPPPAAPKSASAGSSSILQVVRSRTDSTINAANLSALKGKRLGEILVAMGLLARVQVNNFEQESTLAKEFLGKFLIRRGLLTPDQLCKALAVQANLPVVSLADSRIPVATKYRHLVDLMRRCEFVPFSETEVVVFLAAKRPLAPHRVGEVSASFGKDVKLGLAPDHQIDNVLEQLSPGKAAQRRKAERIKLAMPVWFRLCGPNGENPTTILGGNAIDMSMSGLRVEVPDTVMEWLKDSKRRDAFLQIRFSVPPYEVDGIYSLRYLHRKENKRNVENLCVLGLQLTNMGERQRENLKVTFERAVISAKRMEDEFGTQA